VRINKNIRTTKQKKRNVLGLCPACSIDVGWFYSYQCSSCTGVRKKQTADKRTINTFSHHYLYGAGVATPDPGEAPPLAGFNMKSLVAYNHNTPYLHDK